MSSRWRAVLVGLLALVAGGTFGTAARLPGEEPVRSGGDTDEKIQFNRDIRPIFVRHCLACHGGVRRSADLSFVYPETVLPPDGWVIEPGDPDASELIRRVSSTDPDERMPPPEHGEPLTREEVELLKRWIAQGAPWQEHWAFVPPRRPPLPQVSRPQWCRDALDRFVLARLDQLHWQPAPEASPLEWIRRVTFDLTGLPPTPQEVDSFLADRSPDAYQRVVDRLLASPRFGERWAALWMDLARYADSQGYEKDNLRTMWPYRDWLIRAFNQDMPFDRFTIAQLAGDLLPDATLDDVIATAFHRNTLTNAEGGTDDEEFRVAALIDRVNTTWAVWQGITFQCVQCHAHPYLPIEQVDYYRFMALLNTTRDWDLREDLPLLSVPRDREDFHRAWQLDQERHHLERWLVEQTRARNAATPWQPLFPLEATSTGLTQLKVQPGPDGYAEFWTHGTVSHDSRFTLTFQLPPSIRQLTALRIEVLPRRPAEAVHQPEPGFVISQVEAELVRVSGQETDGNTAKPQPLALAWALGDETVPFGDPQRSLHPDKQGWGAKPKLTHARTLVVVLKEPVSVSPGTQLRLTIRQEDAPNDLAPLVMRRSRYAITDDLSWIRWTTGAEFSQNWKRLSEVRQARQQIAGDGLPVLSEQDPHLMRRTARFHRGNWLEHKEVVEPGVPALFGQGAAVTNRLELARWLVSPENPLTARVWVNRVWAELFGRGLVLTQEDFSPSGQAPSHPELLDHLAVRLQEEFHWSLKKLLRAIVLSATYRQTSHVGAEKWERDPQNQWLARGPRQRLTAEMVRDNALAVSGLLSTWMYGPGVMPPQPEGIWRAARSSLKWQTSEGENRYRRALYTIWRRSSPYPSLITFDAPQRLVTCPRRVVTNTPLQALVTLNDPAFVQCAQALARRMRQEAPEDPATQIARGYRWCMGTDPPEGTLDDLLALYQRAVEHYGGKPELAKALGTSIEEAALTIVANALLNLDEVLTR